MGAALHIFSQVDGFVAALAAAERELAGLGGAEPADVPAKRLGLLA